MTIASGPVLSRYLQAILAVAATLWLLVEARPVLEPLMLSVLLWYVLNALARGIARLMQGKGTKPGRLAHSLSAGAVVLAIAGLSVMTSNSIAAFRGNLPTYEANLKAMLEQAGHVLGLGGPLDLAPVLDRIEVSDVVLNLAGSALGITTSLIVVLVYVGFLFVEAGAYRAKLAALGRELGEINRIHQTIARINAEVEIYIGVKCVIGLAQAVPTYIVLALVGVDGAAFWSVLIFVFSFIPTVGSLIGIVFPTLVALAQFASPVPIAVTLIALVVIQLGGSNWLEPRLMGARLNLSPLVILIAIFAGGAVWGVIGALIAVPALAVAVIVFAAIDSMRPVAILLSSNGRIPERVTDREA